MWPWAGVLGLGVWHGVNPAMGWLFAVALGIQEGSVTAVWRALGPLALGHALAVGVAVLVAVGIGWVVPDLYLRWFTAAALVAFGVFRLFRQRHPRWVGMRVGARDLMLWSALMASAHGAGLMVLPFVLAAEGSAGSFAGRSSTSGFHLHDPNQTAPRSSRAKAAQGLPAPESMPVDLAHSSMPAAGPMLGIWATLLHTAAYLLVTGVIAVTVYQRFGLRQLRTAWVNLDIVWAGALILTGVLTLFL